GLQLDDCEIVAAVLHAAADEDRPVVRDFELERGVLERAAEVERNGDPAIAAKLRVERAVRQQPGDREIVVERAAVLGRTRDEDPASAIERHAARDVVRKAGVEVEAEGEASIRIEAGVAAAVDIE